MWVKIKDMKHTLLYLLPLLMLFASCKEVKTNNKKDGTAAKVGPKDGSLGVFILDAQTLVGFIEAKECDIVLDYILGDVALSYEPDATIHRIVNQRTAITVLKGEKLKVARNGIGSVRISYHYSNN